MKREFIHITDNNKHRLMSDSGFWHGSTNENSRDKMKKILSMAVLNGLLQSRQFQHPTPPKSQKIRVKFSVH